jgi:drug/metabolite transporter (DMT)-like permease
MGEMKSMKTGVAAVIAAGCLWGSVGLFVRVLDGLGYSPLTIVFARMSIAFLLLAAFLIARGRGSLFIIKPRDLWRFAGAGVASAIMLNLFYSMSTVMNPLAIASILLATAPVFVVLLSIPLFGEKATPVKIKALVIVFAGCVLTSGLIGGGMSGGALGTISAQGILIGFLASIGWSLYGIMTRVCLNRGYNSLTVNLYAFLLGSLACIPFTDFGVIARSVADAPGSMTVFLVLHTLATSLLPYTLFTYGMKFMDTGRASIIASVEPVVATVLGLFLYAERPDPVTLAGIAAVLFGITLLNLPERRQTL